MAYTIKDTLPSVHEVTERYPVTKDHPIEQNRTEVRRILAGLDRRLLVIVGPCSAWPPNAIEEYAERLARLQEDLRERIRCVMRLYIQKPRTRLGWTGPLNAPDPAGTPNLRGGVWLSTDMMSKASKIVPIADEMLFTQNGELFDRWLSYLAVGARSSQDQEHRCMASKAEPPVGVKHDPSGNLELGVNSVEAVQARHHFAYQGHHIESTGNPYAHLILRGGPTPNYDAESVATAASLLRDGRRHIRNPAIVVDASHDNARNGNGKDPLLQISVVRSVLENMLAGREGHDIVRGFMIESFILEGNRKIAAWMSYDEGRSITDPCIDWSTTEALLRRTADAVDETLRRPGTRRRREKSRKPIIEA